MDEKGLQKGIHSSDKLQVEENWRIYEQGVTRRATQSGNQRVHGACRPRASAGRFRIAPFLLLSVLR